METNENLEEGYHPLATAGQNQSVLSLNELIAEIDGETAAPFDPTIEKEDKSIDLDRRHTSLQNQFIQLALENTLFALPLSSTSEIGRRPDITPLPNLPNWVLGISNVRGEIISFINLKVFFGISSTGNKVERRFLITHNQNMKVGIVVDRILGILSLDHLDDDLQNSPYREGEIANYISGVAVSGDKLINVLDIDRLLSSPRMTAFRES